MLLRILFTLLIGCAGGILALRLKIPAGGVTGAMVAVAVMNVMTGWAAMPWFAKTLAQSVAGAFVVLPVTMTQVKSMGSIVKPAFILVGGMLTASVLMGFSCMATSDMSPMTAFFASATGGMSDLVLIGPDLGADPLPVSVLQVARLFFVLGLCPVINKQVVDRLERHNPARYLNKKSFADVEADVREAAPHTHSMIEVLLTLALAFAGGWLGFFTGLPAGALIGAMVMICAFNLRSGKAHIPIGLRRFAQVCTGSIIGSGVGRENIAGLRGLLVPLIIILVGNVILNMILGRVLFRFTQLDLRTAMFASIPAGISDMALIAGDFNADGSKVALLQTVRLIANVTVFPQVYLLICRLL